MKIKSLRSKLFPIFATATILSAGSANAVIQFMDIALIGVRDTAVDGYAVVALADLDTGDSFFIADAGVDGTAIDTEDVWRVDITNTISAGTVIILDERAVADTLGSPNITTGLSFTPINSGVYSDGSSVVSIASNDAALLFGSTDNAQTEAASTNFFYIATNDTTVNGGTPRGLTEASGRNEKLPITGVENDYYYTGTLTGTQQELFTAISDDSNWTNAATAPDFFTTLLNAPEGTGFGGGFTVIPEPSSSLLSLIGLGTLLFKRRRK